MLKMNSPSPIVGVLSELPSELHYLIEPVLRCGCRSESDVFAFLDRATKSEMNDLALIAARVLKNDHYPQVITFLRTYKMTDFDECVQLYFFFGVLDYANLKFDRVPEKK